MLQRLTALSADQFGVDPEEVDWGHVGTLIMAEVALPRDLFREIIRLIDRLRRPSPPTA